MMGGKEDKNAGDMGNGTACGSPRFAAREKKDDPSF